MEPRVNQRKNDLAALFDKIAPGYDASGPKMFTYFGQHLVDRAGIPTGSSVLDVACGKGAVLFPALEAIGPTGEVVGIDLSPVMIQWLAEEIDHRSIRNARVQVMDAEALQFDSSSFDFILCGLGIFFFPLVDQALSEFMRVLKPGGGVAVSTFGKEDPRWAWFNPLIREFLPLPKDQQSHSSAGTPKPVFNSPTGMNAIFTRAGFEQIQARPVELITSYECKEEWWSSLWSVATRRSLENIETVHGKEGLEQFKARAFALIQGIQVEGPVQKIETVIVTTARKGISP
jgi:ubiquinone/menaquinone biosynthesis C-methylase UbiE